MQAARTDHPVVKKVVIIGPECTGKTDLAVFLGNYFETAFVEEYAREYIDNLKRPYTQADLLRIAHGQVRQEDEQMKNARHVVICDTNLIVIKVWSNYKYGNCDPTILDIIKERPYDLYLLTDIDIPWQQDSQREHPDKRKYFWNIYESEVIETGIPFVRVSGPRDQRQKIAVGAVKDILIKHENLA